MEFRALRADEIECRIGTVSKNGNGVSLLLYKDARCDMNILDETVGATNWQRHHSRENANCIVEIWDAEKKTWVGKEDTGTESNTEAEKGLASDSFKRACFNWGIGRELYTAPFIFIPGADRNDKFWVKDMKVENRVITGLTICRKDQYGNKLDAVVYSYPRKPARGKETAKEPPKEETNPEPKDGYHATQEQVAIIKKRYVNANRTKLLDKYGIPDVEHLPRKVADEICAKLKALDEKKEATA